MLLRLFILPLFFITFSPGFLKAQDHLNLQKEADVYFESDDYPNALIAGESALAYAEAAVGKEHFEYADILGDVAVYNALNGHFETGLSQIDEAIGILKKIKGEDSEAVMEAMHNKVVILHFSGNYLEAEKAMSVTADLYLKAKGENDKDYGVALNTLALIQMEGLKKFKEAEVNLIKSQKIMEHNKMQDSINYSVVLTNLGSVCQDLGDLEKSESYYKLSAKLDRKNKREHTIAYARTLQNISTLYMQMGRYDDARAIIGEEMKLKKELLGEESSDYGMSINNLGYLYDKTGRYAESEELYRRALAIKEKTIGKNHPDYYLGQNNLAFLLFRLGRGEEALTLMTEVLSKVKQDRITNPLNYAFYASNYAVLLSETGRRQEAVKYHEDVIGIYKDEYGETFGEYTSELSNLATTMMGLDEDKKALEILEKAADISKKEGRYDSRENIELLNNLANAYHSDKQFDRAISTMRKVVTLSKSYFGEDHQNYLLFYFNLALFLDQAKQLQEAEKIYADIIEKDFKNLDKNFSALSESEKGSFYTTLISHFDFYYRLAVNLRYDKPEMVSQIFNYRLATKALLMNNSNRIRNSILSGKDEKLLHAYLDWKSQKDYLVKLYSLPSRELALMRVNIDSVEAVVNSREKELSKKSNVSFTGYDASINWKKIQSALKPGEAAIEIIRCYSPFIDETEKVFYIALIVDQTCKSEPKMVVMDQGYEMERYHCKEYRDAIFDSTKSEDAYKHFWELIDHQLAGINKIFISIDGIYAKINLNSVYDKQNKRYLLDKYDIYYLSTLRELLEPMPVSNNAKTAQLYGFPDYLANVELNPEAEDPLPSAEYLLERKNELSRTFELDPLPGTKKEVESILELMKKNGWDAQLFLAKAAQEKEVKQVKSPTVLHIATHGYFDNDVDGNYTPATSHLAEKMEQNPLLRSGLMLAGASNAYSKDYSKKTNWVGVEDGILTAYEAMNLNLEGTELVVLSACETGLGEIRNGEGVYGLQRAFQAAGARALIMSLWPVSDAATQKLMTLFYSSWLSGKDKHEAFRYAQRELKKTYPDPYYWSAFVMIGR